MTSPFAAFGISVNDPLMVAAIQRARATWPQFAAIYPEHREDSVVKFRLRTKSGNVENVWGDLLELDADSVLVHLHTLPVEETEIDDLTMRVPLSEVVDWQVVFPDGSLRGGFTQQATFRILEREHGSLPKDYAEQLLRYRELDGAAG